MMIQQFKTKEQLKREQVYELAKDLNGVIKERFIRLALDTPQKKDRLFYSNLLIKAKLDLRKAYITLEKYYEKRKNVRAKLEYYNDKDLIEYENALNEGIESYESFILSHGKTLVDCILPMINKYFTENEIVQLVGGSKVAAKEYKETMERLDLKGCKVEDGGFAFDFIYHHGEYRWRKGRATDFIDCPEWEMPLFNAISEYIIHQIKNTPKLKYEMDKKCEEMFEDIMVYATFDNNGNIIDTEKINQEIKIKELLLNYKDLEPKGIITRIKKESMIDMDKNLKLHKNEGNNYTVLDAQGEKLGYVFKIK